MENEYELKMEIYDFMYSKCALDIYTYFFSNVKLNKEKEAKVKNIIYISYMYASYYSKDKTMERFFDFFQEISYITDIDCILNKDEYLSQFYQLFKMHKDILQENRKNEYQLCLNELKELILKTNIEDVMYFIKIKNNVDEIYEKIYYDNIPQEELGTLKNIVKEQLEYLKNYLPSSDIKAYESYFNMKNEENMGFAVNLGIKLFELNKKNIKFSELKQIEDLENKTHAANRARINNLGYIEVNKEEQKQISSYVIKKIFKNIVLFIILYFMIGRIGILSYKEFIETKNNTILIPGSICLLIIALQFIEICNYIFVICKVKNKERIKGMIGFIGDITWNTTSSSSPSQYYDIYFPQYDTQYSILAKCSSQKLKRKNAVKLIKVATKKMIIPISQKDI